jgi:hypothetical protein
MLTAEQPRATSRFLVEPASQTDDAALRSLFRRTSMGSGIEVSFEREPSYFDALEIQGDRSEVGIVRDRQSGQIVASGTRVARKGFLNGELTDVGYLGDLRIDPEFRNRTLASRIYRALQERDSWCDWYYTVIFEENVRALETVAKARAGLPTYHYSGRLLCPGIETSRPPSPFIRAWNCRAHGSQERSSPDRRLPESKLDSPAVCQLPSPCGFTGRNAMAWFKAGEFFRRRAR